MSFRQKSYVKRYGFSFLFFTIILAFYLRLIFTGLRIETPIGLIIQLTGQKIVLYTFAVCLLIHGYATYKIEKGSK